MTPINRSADEIKSSFLPLLLLGSPVCSIPVLQVSPASLSTSFLLAWRRFVSSTVPRPLQGNFPRPGDLPRHPSGAQKECHWLSLDWPLGVQGTNHWTTNGIASPCFGFVSDLPAQSRGRLLSGVGRTGFIDTLPTLSDPRRPCLPSHEKFATPNLHDSNSDIPNKAERQRQDKDRSYEWTSVWNAKP
ncbi:hypothetical protein GE21DRAFT_1045877 [Neurospora crassa]|nr:hypothetical protein GE21DRAFT_1045877 [Neurospora crassa]